jgi:hypothetical protein
MMNGTIDMVITIPEVLKKSEATSREVQILIDGMPHKTINDRDIESVEISELQVVDNTTITIELREVCGTTMSAPLVHEFMVVDGYPSPQSDIFDIVILSR